MKKYVCEGCRGTGKQEELVSTPTVDFDFYEPVKYCPCSLCAVKGYTSFVMAKTPEDDQLIDAIKKGRINIVSAVVVVTVKASKATQSFIT